MQSITCRNEECGEEIGFAFSDLHVEESELSGNHTTQHSSSGEVLCKICGTETEINCVWDELDDTGEVLSISFS